MDDEKMVLNTDDEAATYRTDISGWVSRNGRYFGDDERLARWDGCTHILCDCGEPTEKPWTKCKKCREAERDKHFATLEKKPWDGKVPLCIWDDDQYFWSEEEIEEYCEELGLELKELKLLICEPVYAREINPDEYYEDDLPEGVEGVEDDLWEEFEALNKYIRETKPILSWMPSKYAAVLTEVES